MGAKLGLDAKAYRLSTGTRATWGTADANGMAAGAAPASLDEITNTQDVTLNIESAEADASTRGNNGWEAVLSALKKGSVDLVMVHDPADTDFIALMKAWLTRVPIAIAFLSGDKATAGVDGMWADWTVLRGQKAEPLQGTQMFSFTLKPTLTAVPPEWVKVTGA